MTIVIKHPECLFGDVVDEKMVLNQYGVIIKAEWEWLKHQYEYVDLDEWVVMPNHLHGIIILHDGRGGSRTAPTEIIEITITRFFMTGIILTDKEKQQIINSIKQGRPRPRFFSR